MSHLGGGGWSRFMSQKKTIASKSLRGDKFKTFLKEMNFKVLMSLVLALFTVILLGNSVKAAKCKTF